MMSAIFAAIDIYRHREAYDALQDGKMKERSLDDARTSRPGKPQIA
jgi:hypothetical protein